MRVRLIWMLVVVVVAVPVAAVAVASASSSHKVKMDGYGKAKTTGNKVAGHTKGTPFGNCKENSVVVVPKLNFKFTCPKGTVTGAFTITSPLGDDVIKSTWKITKGTGKFKGAKGSGKMNGKLSTGAQHMTGTVKY
jgi:hypothetical protein